MSSNTYPSDLGGQLRRNAWLYASGTVLLALQQIFMAKRDFLIRAAVDAADARRGHDATSLALWMFAVSIFAAVVRILSRVTMFSAGRNVEYELRAVLLSRLHRLGPSFFRKMPTGEIMSRSTNDLTQVRLLTGFGALNVASAVFSFASAFYVMLSISIKLTLMSLIFVPVLWAFTRSFSVKMFTHNRANQEALGKMSDRVLSSLAGVRVVRLFSLEEEEARIFDEANRSYLEKSLALAKIRGSMGPILGFISAISMLVVFWYGGRLVIMSEVTKGDFISFWMALLRLAWPMLAVGFVAAIVQRGRAGYMRLKEIFDATPDVFSGNNKEETVQGSIRVCGLSFAYGERQVLRDVSFEVPAGKSLAIVGKTGSGKTTLGVLLARLMPTPKGSVFLDNVDICDLPIETVRGNIGYAQQDAFLFSTTVVRNIGYSLPEPDDALDVVREAAEEAQILQEVLRLPDGFDTVVGERGVQLSGGQRQRVALARSLIRQPPVLLLDDPLSAVDAKTEKAILDTIERQAQKRTVLLITHRVAAARRCDEVIVLDEGRVVERGTHEKLLQNNGIYAEFAREQKAQEDLEQLSLQSITPGATL